MSHDGEDAGDADYNEDGGDAGHREDGEDADDDAGGANICCASKTLQSETQSTVMIKPVKDLQMIKQFVEHFIVDVNCTALQVYFVSEIVSKLG